MTKKIDVVLIEKIQVVYNATPEAPEVKAGVQVIYRDPMNSASESKTIPTVNAFQIHAVNEMLRNLLTSIKEDPSEVKFDNFKQWSDMIDKVSELVKDKPFTLYEDSKNGFTFM